MPGIGMMYVYVPPPTQESAINYYRPPSIIRRARALTLTAANKLIIAGG